MEKNLLFHLLFQKDLDHLALLSSLEFLVRLKTVRISKKSTRELLMNFSPLGPISPFSPFCELPAAPLIPGMPAIMDS